MWINKLTNWQWIIFQQFLCWILVWKSLSVDRKWEGRKKLVFVYLERLIVISLKYFVLFINALYSELESIFCRCKSISNGIVYNHGVIHLLFISILIWFNCLDYFLYIYMIKTDDDRWCSSHLIRTDITTLKLKFAWSESLE
jgi:hypothetical protein